jgi:hypothetical protein
MIRVNLAKVVAAAAISGALGFTALGPGAGTAKADDGHGPWGPWVPWGPGEVAHDWVPWVPWVPWGDWRGDQGDNEQ